MAKKRAQYSIDMIITVAFGFMLLIGVSMFFFFYSHDETDSLNTAYTENLANTMLDYAKQVSFKGKGNKIVEEIYFPDKVENITIERNDTIVFAVRTKTGVSEVTYPSNLNLRTNINNYNKGYKKLIWEVYSSDFVTIGDVSVLCDHDGFCDAEELTAPEKCPSDCCTNQCYLCNAVEEYHKCSNDALVHEECYFYHQCAP